ncbi:ParA family protein [Prevotella sp. HUN102]|uniref:ParA family protein n=1 Tax=Prevotella sp. HUN102 TaxID=1392486 RepID=UPI000491C0B9|nr:ParA family protein [Prevotella sp. HUN102]
MKNKKIVFANQKGGVGKSTLCILFANYLAFKRKPVCIIDTDLQKTILMQRQKDAEIYQGVEEPYSVQDFDVSEPEVMQQLMDSASEVDGYVLFDSPGNVSEDGLVPLFANADYIICPYEYEDKTLDSTGTFVQVINMLKAHNPDMHAEIFFVPNRIDPRIGTSDEQRMWNETNEIFQQIGKVTPVVNSRATLKRINTFELLATQRQAVQGAFDYMLKRMK